MHELSSISSDVHDDTHTLSFKKGLFLGHRDDIICISKDNNIDLIKNKI
jgi:hypothetical protein